MTCPYREYDGEWFCSLTEQDCPEAYLEGFEYDLCSTYKEEVNK